MVPNTSSPSTTLEGPSSPFLHFPNWSFLDDVDEELFLSQMLSQQHNINAPVTHDAPVHVPNGANLPTTARANMISCEGDSVAMKAVIPKKAKHLVFNQKKKKKKMEIIPSNRRAGKKDRHSKICTAQGLRDRRMRLSLEIARKFFDLQDMLGFDKASKTIEWLLKNCKAAIQQLTNSHGGEKSMSFSASEESEVESEAKMEIKQICEEEQEPLVGIACRKKRKRRNSCNEVGAMIITNIHVARESRDKARARARERTREKLMKGQLDQNSNTNSTDSYPRISNKHHHLHAAGHQDSGNNSSPQADLFEEPHASVAVMEELLGITRSSSSSSTFSYNSPDFAANHNKEFLGFLAIQKGLEATIEPAPGCYTMTSIKPSLGNVQIQNIPNEMFRTTMNIAQEYDSPADPSSTFMTISNGGQWNPSSIFVTAPAGTLDQQNHFPNSSILMTRKSNPITTPMFTATRPNNVSFQSHFQGSQFP